MHLFAIIWFLLVMGMFASSKLYSARLTLTGSIGLWLLINGSKPRGLNTYIWDGLTYFASYQFVKVRFSFIRNGIIAL